jgi:predicted  nucleic acid-binding Zn-ribbon protein
MAENYVSKLEFDNLKQEVEEIKKDMSESTKMLQAIDKKIDIINEKIITADKIDDFRFRPIEKRVKKLEDDQTWLWRTVIASIIGLLIKVLFDVSKFL